MNRIAIAAAAVVAVAGGGFLLTQGTGSPTAPGSTQITLAGEAQAQTAPEGEVDLSRVVEMVVGNADAPVTIIEYSSFTCPHCANFNRGVYREIYDAYVETGVVQIIKREVYFDAFGLWAALVARCGGSERYFGIVEMLYEGQRDWAAAQPTAGQSQAEAVADQLRRIGRRAGMNDEELNVCLGDRDMALALMETYRRNAAEHQVTSTPSFVINGQRYSNMSFGEFEAAIARARGT